MRAAPAPQLTAEAWLLLLALSLAWGGSFFFGDLALRELSPLLVAWGRVASGALFLGVMLRLAGHRWPRGWRSWSRYFSMGLMNNALPFTFILLGQQQVGGAAAAILNATTPAFAVVLAHFVTADERLTPGRGVGVLLGALGVALLVGLDSLEGLGGTWGPALLVLCGALSYALAGIYGRRFRGDPPLVTATGQVVASTILLAPVALLLGEPRTLPLPGPTTWLALAGLGLISTAVAYRLYFRILILSGATNLLLVTLMIPPSAMLLQWLFLHRAVGLPELAGFALIALGLIAIDGRLLRLLRSLRSARGKGAVGT